MFETRKPGWYVGRYLTDRGQIGGPNFEPNTGPESFLGDGDERPKVGGMETMLLAALAYYDGTNFLGKKPVPEPTE